MFTLSKRFIYALSNKTRRIKTENSEKKLEIDFSKTKKSPFEIKSESAYNSYLSDGSFTLCLKKSNFIGWVEIPENDYDDHVIEAKIRLDNFEGYAAAGLLFHIMDDETYYIALVSSKGYFRVDAVKHNNPKPLIAWTEISEFNKTGNITCNKTYIHIKIITYGTYMIFIVNDKWVGKASNDSINYGRIGFALASYEAASYETVSDEAASGETTETSGTNEYTCKAMLDYFSVDTRIKTIEENFNKWDDDSNINAEYRLRLAETYAVMGETSKSLEQIYKAWKRRDEAISSVAHNYTEVRTRKELLLAARMSFRLGQYNEAGEFTGLILEQWENSAEGREALTEKIKILNELEKFAELKEFIIKYQDKINKDIVYYSLTARCYWELKEYEKSAEAWDKAFELDSENGVFAANAANALEYSGDNNKALSRLLEAGKIFLRQDNRDELLVIIPKLSLLGKNNWEARALAGKWAYSNGDYEHCKIEFSAAEKLRCAVKPRPKADPALYYLWGLVLGISGTNSVKGNINAVKLLERAVKLAPDYGLFRFKLAEFKLTRGETNPEMYKALIGEFKLAIKNMDADSAAGMAHHAGTLLLNAGDKKNAKYFFEISNVSN